MECTSNNSAKFQQDHEYDNGSCGGGDDDDDDVEQKNKATTSGSNPREEEEEIQINKTGNVITTVQTSSSPTMTMIVKGKRTKRQRLHSPSIPSDVPMGDKTQEEDMANCLILLAQGQSRPSSSSPPPPFIRRNQQLGLSSGRFSYENKRSYRSSIAGVYECKTCSRTFSSFQALGGHRASHKKLKITTAGKHLTINLGSDSPPASSSSPLSLQLGNINYKRAQSHNNKSINKVHECSVCGAEFSSGQALGGHMRRHRGTAIPLNSSTTTTTTTDNRVANTTLSLSTAIAGESATATAKVDRINTSNNGLLSLDLNLPLPASPSPEDHDETKFSFASKQPQSQQQQQSAMLFSTPALVDCFY